MKGELKMSQIKKYIVILKYKGYPEFKIETTATSDDEAMKNALDKLYQQQPSLKGQEIVSQNVVSSNDPY